MEFPATYRVMPQLLLSCLVGPSYNIAIKYFVAYNYVNKPILQ